MRNVVSAFGRVARGFVSPDGIHTTRLNLKHAALRLKHDASHARSWGFLTIGTLAYRLLDRKQDSIDKREGNLRSYAERAVWLTHFLADPDKARSVKQDILHENIDGISVEELDAYLVKNVGDFLLHGASREHAEIMKANVRQTLVSPSGSPSAGIAPELA